MNSISKNKECRDEYTKISPNRSFFGNLKTNSTTPTNTQINTEYDTALTRRNFFLLSFLKTEISSKIPKKKNTESKIFCTANSLFVNLIMCNKK